MPKLLGRTSWPGGSNPGASTLCVRVYDGLAISSMYQKKKLGCETSHMGEIKVCPGKTYTSVTYG